MTKPELPYNMTAERVALFWQKVAKANGCWLWTACRHPEGYGYFWTAKGKKLAHRISYSLSFGAIPSPQLQVCHKCDVRLCVNPQHLFLGTNADNCRDMAEKGRSTRGERQWCAKLTEADVKMIAFRLSGGEMQKHIARDMGVSQQAISDIATGRVWSWLTQTKVAA